jgi:hypothetical protein
MLGFNGSKKLGNVIPDTRRHRGLHSVAGKIHPFQKMRDLVSANAQGDLQHLGIRHFLTHSRVKTGATLLNGSEMKSRDVRDGLDLRVAGNVEIGVGRAVIGIGPGDGRNPVERDRLGKAGAEIRIGGAAIADEPARVDVELREIGDAKGTTGPRGSASGQRAESFQADRLASPERQILVDKGGMAHFIQRVAGDVLRAIRIEVRQGCLVGI